MRTSLDQDQEDHKKCHSPMQVIFYNDPISNVLYIYIYIYIYV